MSDKASIVFIPHGGGPLQVCYGIGQDAATVVFQERVAGFITSAYQWG
jgi:hypothetical protein